MIVMRRVVLGVVWLMMLRLRVMLHLRVMRRLLLLLLLLGMMQRQL